YDHRDVPGGVAVRWHDRDPPVPCRPEGAGERPERLGAERDRPRGKPTRPVVRQGAAEPAGGPTGIAKLLVADEDLGLREMAQPAHVVGMQVGYDDRLHVLGTDADLAQPGADLLLRLDLDPHGPPEVGMPRREIARPARSGRLAGVDDDHPVVG